MIKKPKHLKLATYGKSLRYWSIFIFGLMLTIFVLGGCGEEKGSVGETQNSASAGQTKSVQKENEYVKPVKILFVGDMMFDRYIREAAGKYGEGNFGYIFEPIKNDLAKYDLVVGNLEGPVTEKPSVSVRTAMEEKRNFEFTFDPAIAKTLFENNIRLVSLGNNHILNQGEAGLEQSKKYLTETGVEYFGDTGDRNVIASGAKQSRGAENGSESPRSFGTRDGILIKEIQGARVGFVNYNYSVRGSFEKAVGDIGDVRDKADFVFVCPHWGTEYKTGDPGQGIKIMAKQFIDAGADAVIGTHPHVVQTSEVFKGKKIYYSLGNFVFDQYFRKESTEGLGVELTISANGKLEYNEMKFVMNRKGQTELK